MAGETFATPGTVAAGDAARASWAQKVHETLVVLGKSRYVHLGGNEMDGHTSESYERLRSAVPIDLCEEDYRGLTLTLVVLMRVANASGTVQVRLRNTDDGSNVAETTAENDTTLTRYTAAVTLPTTPQQVAEIVLLARKHGLPVVARGAGTGLSGGAVPQQGGIIVSLTRMNRVLEIDREDRTAHGGVAVDRDRDREQRGHRQGAREVVRGHRERIRRAAAAQRVDAPRDPGRGHEAGAEGIRCGEAGQRQRDEAAGGEREADPLERARSLAARDAPADHRGLHHREQDQRAGAGGEPEIGERERGRVGEERGGGAPAAGAARGCARGEGEQHERARAEAQQRERRRIDRAIAERGAAQQRVRREPEERGAGERGDREGRALRHDAIMPDGAGARSSRPVVAAATPIHSAEINR